jgi:hypothetical protein
LRRLAQILIGIILAVGSARAEDVWVVQFGAFGGIVYPPCGGIIWYDDLIFHNGTDTSLSVQALETSNGGSINSVPLVIPPHSTRSGYGSLNSEIGSWAPDLGHSSGQFTSTFRQAWRSAVGRSP